MFTGLLIGAIDGVLTVLLVMAVISIADFVIAGVTLLVVDEVDFVVVRALLDLGEVLVLIVLIDQTLDVDGFFVLLTVEVMTSAVSKIIIRIV